MKDPQEKKFTNQFRKISKSLQGLLEKVERSEVHLLINAERQEESLQEVFQKHRKTGGKSTRQFFKTTKNKKIYKKILQQTKDPRESSPNNSERLTRGKSARKFSKNVEKQEGSPQESSPKTSKDRRKVYKKVLKY
ncbi:9778_t:CDS:2 [Cetraspora pellucida]|uniref:9778_t:CDS:1 n=1 Tax=Cetraspora pellucida TaxID=1433469 RepID=A0A9N9NI62_9GLOM|nr:9778_t:CDS:2 [Cetraspora pellucida]